MHIERDRHCVICLDFKFHQLYIVWIFDDIDSVLTNDELKILTFKNQIELLKYWNKHIKETDIEPVIYNAFVLQQWLLQPHTPFDYVEFLSFWNLFTDVSHSVKIEFSGDVKGEIRNSVYEKLFDASGVFVVDYDPRPTFAEQELNILKEIMQNGFDLLMDSIAVIEK